MKRREQWGGASRKDGKGRAKIHMFTVEELLSKRNQRDAFQHFETKKDGCGPDGMRLSELKEYWQLNHERIEDEIMAGDYRPGVIKSYEILKGSGRKRTISSINVTDRFITRLLVQKLRRYLEPDFLAGSFAYQEGKGALEAVMKAREYAEAGNVYMAEIDIQDFFDTIPLKPMMQALQCKLSDERVLALIREYLFCRIDTEGRIMQKNVGLLQGSSISPILSNLYMNSLDTYMQDRAYSWIRFADNIYIFAPKQEDAAAAYEDVCGRIDTELKLKVNLSKSGVHHVTQKALLGYELYLIKGKFDVRKHKYQPTDTYHNWHESVVQKIDREYHILQDGVLNKKDYALLFENDQERHHIPVEVVDQLNVYGEVSMSYSALRTLGDKNIKVSVYDKYGNLMGQYVPEKYHANAAALIRQCLFYDDGVKRLDMARQMEIASLHNMRANLRYYQKKGKALDEYIALLTKCIVELNEQKDINALMLIEARARQKYYSAFNLIMDHTDFVYTNRSKRPPRDQLNAMISFGNTLLYGQFLQMIWKTSLNPQIGVVHAANRRSCSLNLDFADIFKPVITDRVIFMLANCQKLKKAEHFEAAENGGVYLNKSGKRIFIEEFDRKLETVLTYKGRNVTYRQLMQEEVRQFQRYILSGEKYKPYKYY